MQLDKTLDGAFARYLAGRDPSALGEVFDLAAPEVLRVATYLCADVATAEDVVQATFLAAIEGADRFERGRPVMPWLLGILANQVRTQKRRAARRPDAARLQSTASTDPADSAARREADAAVRTAIEQVDEPYRDVLRMSLQDGLEPKEIARSLDRPQGTVRSQLHRGLDLLRKALPVGLSLAGVTATRGLAAMRADVVQAAGRWGGGAGVGGAAAAVGASVLSKKVVLAAVFVAVLLTTGWMVQSARRADSNRPRRDTVAQADEAQREADRAETTGTTARREDPRRDSAFTVLDADLSTIELRVQVGKRRAAGVHAIARAISGVDSSVFYTTGVTDARGRARMVRPARARTMIQMLSGPTVVVASNMGSGVDIVMAEGVTVAGRVLDPTGRPVPNASVVAYGMVAEDGLEVARTDRDGRYTARHMGEDLYFSARAHGWSPAPLVEMAARGGDDVRLDLKLPARGGAMRAMVRDAAGTPVPDAVVFIGDRVRRKIGAVPHVRGVSDKSGVAAFEGLLPGTYPLTVRTRGYVPWRGEVTVRVDDESIQSVELRAAAVVKGRVLDADGQPLAGEQVTILSTAATLARPKAWSAEDGTYRLDELPAGEVTLTAGSPTGLHAKHSFLLVAGETVEWDARIPKGAVIEGVVLDDNRAPRVNWAVEIWGRGTARGWHHQMMTDDKGRFRVEVPQADATYNIKAKANWPDRGWRVKVVDVGPGTGVIEMIAREADRARLWVQGVLQTATGEPLGGLAVMAFKKLSPGPAGRTSHRTGAFKVGPLKPGRFNIVVMDMAGKHPVLVLGERDVSDGATLDLGTIRMPVPGRLRIRVVAPEGAKNAGGGPAGMLAMLAQLMGAETEADGARLYPLMAPGKVMLNASCTYNGKELVKQVEVEIRSGETTEVTITLP